MTSTTDHTTGEGIPAQTATTSLDRRRVLQGTAAVLGTGAVVAVLSACGDDSNPSDSAPTNGTDQEQPQEQAPGATTSAGVIVAAADVPVGGGSVQIVGDRKVVVTQPTAGQYFGFSAVCTHQGCAVNNISDGRIMCPCHGSAFDASTGAVLNGPATAPLASIAVREDGDEIVFA